MGNLVKFYDNLRLKFQKTIHAKKMENMQVFILLFYFH